MSNTLRNKCLGLTALVFIVSVGCRSDRDPPGSPTGAVRLALTGTAQGITYRLRNARFVVSSPATGAELVLDSEIAPEAALLTATLATGAYTINLQSGWALDRADTGQVVEATLNSPNPTTFQILPGSTTNLTYRFSSSGSVITIGTGALNIGIEVTINPDGGAPDGGGAGCTSSPDSCGVGFVCQTFDDGSGIPRNMCVLSCDPVTQQRGDGAPACGSPNPAAPSLGCYGIDGKYFCAPAGNASQTHGVPAASPGGPVFVNACAPGYQPFFFASSTDSTVLCTAYCEPATTHQGSAGNANGVPPNTCAARGAPAGTECRFLSGYVATPTSITNSIGVCFNPAAFTYDHDSNPATPNVPLPSCATLSSLDTDANGIPDYLDWNCGPASIP